MGRSRNTGNITIVLYEDPPDTIPKIHVRSSKWMAWIAEQNLPTYLHVDRVHYYTRLDQAGGLLYSMFSREKQYNLTSGGYRTWLSLGKK